ncbi:hypothetical protein [Streptomyces sulfonofaciens]|nr:hypothetical protein [Streptomyces sulfonofaciens]
MTPSDSGSACANPALDAARDARTAVPDEPARCPGAVPVSAGT